MLVFGQSCPREYNALMSSPDPAAGPDAALRTLTGYYSAFSTLDVPAVLPYFHEPCLFVNPQGVLSVPNSEALAAVLTSVLEALRAREFDRSLLSATKVQSLSESTCLITGVAVRYKRNGQELERVGVTYVLQKTDHAWKIAVIVLHDPPSA